MKIDLSKPMEVVYEDGEVVEVEDSQYKYTCCESCLGDVAAIWVRRVDGEPFRKGGTLNVFGADGRVLRGYEESAKGGLRNKKETQTVTQNEYTEFMPFHGGLAFRPFPLNVRVIDKQGNMETLNLRGSNDMALIKDCVAIAFEKVDPIKVEARRLMDVIYGGFVGDVEGQNLTQPSTLIEAVLRQQELEGKKVDVNPKKDRMPTWFLELMEQCGIFSNANYRTVWAWYNDTANANTSEWRLAPVLARKLNNKLLSIRPFSGGGQLVITPYGHGLAVTNAKKLYWQWKAGEYRRAYGMGSHENNGGYKPHYEKRTITVTDKGVEIGCQHIPHMAFTRLAERLDWPNKDPYGGY